jgi:hypothetical protein
MKRRLLAGAMALFGALAVFWLLLAVVDLTRLTDAFHRDRGLHELQPGVVAALLWAGTLVWRRRTSAR